MEQKAPTWVTEAIHSYDSALRLRWSPLTLHFILERKISNASVESKAPLKQTLARIKARMDRVITDIEETRAVIEKSHARREKKRAKLQESDEPLDFALYQRALAAEKLDCLEQGYNFIFRVPPPTANEPWSRRLECILYTLQSTDVWAAGGADKYHNEMLDQDEADEQRAEATRQDDIRHGAGAVYEAIQRKRGSRISFARFIPKGLPAGLRRLVGA